MQVVGLLADPMEFGRRKSFLNGYAKITELVRQTLFGNDPNRRGGNSLAFIGFEFETKDRKNRSDRFGKIAVGNAIRSGAFHSANEEIVAEQPSGEKHPAEQTLAAASGRVSGNA